MYNYNKIQSLWTQKNESKLKKKDHKKEKPDKQTK